MDIDIITATAKVAHEANKAWCEENGDYSQPSWKDAPEWQRKSAINGVVFHSHFPSAGDSASHDNWMREKLAAGWVHGEFKDPEANPPTHPCLVPFEDLPEFQQKKDAIFRSVVHAALNLKPSENMSFGEAVKRMKEGYKVKRAGWNRGNMFLYLAPGSTFNVSRAPLLGIYPEGTELTYRPHIDIKTSDGTIASWSPSGSDALADDWVIVQ